MGHASCNCPANHCAYPGSSICRQRNSDVLLDAIIEHMKCEGCGHPKHPETTCNQFGCECALNYKPELRLREGDQPLPVKNDLPLMYDLVKEDMEARKQLGIKRYGTALQPHNGRDALRDAYEEILDHAAYLRQMLYEREGK